MYHKTMILFGAIGEVYEMHAVPSLGISSHLP
jgi:hypothetical protein